MEKIGVIGLGYVGLPLAIALNQQGYEVVGYDINTSRIKCLKDNIDITSEVSQDDLEKTTIVFTHDPSDLKDVTFYVITVPTPINEVNRPDLTMIYSATKTVANFLKKGDVVVYESTVYPGVTEDECVPILEEVSKLTLNHDFGVGYSPERINPGDKTHRIQDIKKIISGSNQKTLDRIFDVYGKTITAGIFKAKNIKTAEAAKVIENIQRDLNIALINEFSMIFNRLNINTYDVLEAASTKWNFSKYEPGLVGGHCIGVDPYYLTHCAEKVGYHPEVILSGRRINNNMSQFISLEVLKRLSKLRKSTNNLKVTIFGITFKENVPDIRNSKVIDIINILKEFNVEIQVCDPLANPREVKDKYNIQLVPYSLLEPSDGIIFAVKHKEFLEKGWDIIKPLQTGEKIFVADLKNSLKSQEKPENLVLWSL